MITAKLALKQRRPLLALPGQVGMSVAEGVNELIKSGKAVMTTSANDLLSALNLVPGQIKMKLEKECEDPITGILESGPRSADELMRILKMPVAELMSRLSVLNLSGVVAENNGKYSKLC
jgi:DNA processing protein